MIKIVESLHETKSHKDREKEIKKEVTQKRSVKELQLLLPLTAIDANLKVFLDEDDNQNETRLYFSGPGKREIEEKNRDGGNSPDVNEKTG